MMTELWQGPQSLRVRAWEVSGPPVGTSDGKKTNLSDVAMTSSGNTGV